MQELPGGGTGDDRYAEPSPSAERTWVHPSELGLEHRKRSDRRRGMWLGAGLVLGGFGLLAMCAAMGGGSDPTETNATVSSQEAGAATLVSLTVVSPDGSHNVTGVVLDDDGHVVVRASAVDDASELWASCVGRAPAKVEVVARSGENDLAVVAMGEGSGTAATADSDLEVGDEVLLANAGTGEAPPQLRRALVTQAPTTGSTGTGSRSEAAAPSETTAGRITVATLGPTATTQLASTRSATDVARSAPPPVDGAMFTDRGRFLGLVIGGTGERTEVLPAATVLDAALALIS